MVKGIQKFREYFSECAGESVDSRSIKKHRNDVIRLAAALDPQTRLTVNEEIRNDVELYLDAAARRRLI